MPGEDANVSCQRYQETFNSTNQVEYATSWYGIRQDRKETRGDFNHPPSEDFLTVSQKLYCNFCLIGCTIMRA